MNKTNRPLTWLYRGPTTPTKFLLRVEVGVGRWWGGGAGFQGLAETAELRLKRKPNKSRGREQPSFSPPGPGVLTIMLQVSVAGRDVVLFSLLPLSTLIS